MRVRVRVPATSANLGPGFDALGLALALYNDVTLEEADRVSVAVEGEGSGRLDEGAKNVVARGAALAFEIAGRALPGVRLRCVNRIPLGRGLGSSAAAWVGGLVAANALMGEPLDQDALLAARHPRGGPPGQRGRRDPGGLTVSCADGRGRHRGEPVGAARDRVGRPGSRDRELDPRGARGAARVGARAPTRSSTCSA